MYVCLCVCLSLSIYIYIYIEREREREGKKRMTECVMSKLSYKFHKNENIHFIINIYENYMKKS